MQVLKIFTIGMLVATAPVTWALTPTFTTKPAVLPSVPGAISVTGPAPQVLSPTSSTPFSPAVSSTNAAGTVTAVPLKTTISPMAPAPAPVPAPVVAPADLGALIKTVQSSISEIFSSPDTSNLPTHEPRQLVISWVAVQQPQVLALLAASQGRITQITALPSLGLNIAVLAFDTQPQADAALARLLSATPAVTADKLATLYNMQAGSANPVQPASSVRQYALGLLKAINKNRVTTPVVLGMVDTEIATPESLATTSIKSRRLFAASDKPASTDHGSAVAAILASKSLDGGFHGLAQGVHLRAAGVMREVAAGVNATNTVLVAQAIDWLMSENAHVINLSLGSAPDAVMAAVVSKAVSAGVVLVAAAGNGGSAAAPSYPAAYPGVIAVTAIDANKQLYTRANQGSYIAIAAPGVDVWVPVGKGKYMSGTSFAAPFVAAAIAQKLAQNPQPKGPQTAQNLLKTLCSNTLPLSTQNPSPEFGCGLMQL